MDTYDLMNFNKYFVDITSFIENNNNLNSSNDADLEFEKHSRIEAIKSK